MSSTTEPGRLPQGEADRKNVRSTWLISAFTLVSRILGYARFILTIHLFSSMRWVSDALIFAFRIPNLFRNLLGEGALSAAFIPVFIRTREKEGAESASSLGSQCFTLLSILGGLITVVGVAVCLAAVKLFGGEEDFDLGLKLTAIFMVFMPLTCCAALLGGMLQGLRRFSLPACLSIIMNIGFLAGFTYVYWWQAGGDLGQIKPEAVYPIALFVLIAGVVEVVIQLPVLLSERIRVVPTLSFNHPNIKNVLKAFVPTALGLGLVQINAFCDSVIAGSLSLENHGAMTYLEIGFRFMQLPLGVFGVAIATASFPEFSSAAADNDDARLTSHLVRAIRMSTFFLLPATAVLMAMADPVIRLTCQRPDLLFDHAAVYRSSLVLIIYSAGLLFYSLRQILVRAYYAKGEYSYPVKVSVAMVILNVTLNLILIHCPDLYRANVAGYFQYWNIAPDSFPNGLRLGEAGLALATFITAVVDSTILWLGLRKRMAPVLKTNAGKKSAGALANTLLRLAAASIAVGILTWLFRNSIPYDPGFIELATRTVVPCLLALGAFYIIGIVFSLPEFGEFFYPLFTGKKPKS